MSAARMFTRNNFRMSEAEGKVKMNRMESITAHIEEIEALTSKKKVKKLQLDRLKRLIFKLDAFAEACAHCSSLLDELQLHLEGLQNQAREGQQVDVKMHNKTINSIIAHLTKEHQQVSEGYYTGIYMSLGLSLGIVFGLLVFDNISIGLPIGLAVGVAIGAGKDAEMKKKGKTV